MLKGILDSSGMDSSMGVGAAIYGPLLNVLRICALRMDVRSAILNEPSECKKLKSWAKVIFLWLIGVLILYRCVVLAINQHNVMENITLMGLNAIQLAASFLSLIGFLLIYFWQHGGFLKSFPTEIETATRLKALKSTEKDGNYLRPWHTFWLVSLVATLAVTAATEVELFCRKPILGNDHLMKGTLQYISILLFIPNVLILLWSVVCGICSIALLNVLHKTILSELTYFNNEIVEAAANGQLQSIAGAAESLQKQHRGLNIQKQSIQEVLESHSTRIRRCLKPIASGFIKYLQHVDLLINYASRHIDILVLSGIFNQRISIFISTWIVLSLFPIIFNFVNFFTSIGNWSTAILNILLMTIWTIDMGVVLSSCFSLYMQIRRTRHLLLYEKSIWQNANEKICLLVTAMVKRIEIFHHLKLFGIITIEPYCFMKISFVLIVYFALTKLMQIRLSTQSMNEDVLANLLNRTDD